MRWALSNQLEGLESKTELSLCCRLNICILPRFICRNLIPNVVKFGDGLFGGD